MRPRSLLATTTCLAGLALVLGTAPIASAHPPASVPSATVCIPFLSGTGCVVFQEQRPNRPGTSKGMKVSLSPKVLTNDGELVMQISGFKPGEGLQRWNYNIFGEQRMNEYTMDYRQADGKGRFRWVVSPSTSIYEPSWGKPALCVRGIKSQRLACAEFTVAGADDSGTSDPSNPTTPSTPATPGTGSATPTPTPSSSLPPNCKDYGFTVMCTG
jgi:hypothetical protein